MRTWARSNKRLWLGVFCLVILAGAIVALVLYQNSSSNKKCGPLDKDTLKLVEQKKIRDAYKSVGSLQCAKPSPDTYKALNAKQKTQQFNVNFSLAEEAYRSGDKDNAKHLANNSISAYQSLSQLEKEQMTDYITKLVILNEIKQGVYASN